MSYRPISDYGLIGNMLSAALVSRDGSIDWCCLPRFDSPSVLAAILDDEKGGRFEIRPRQAFKSHQAYLPNTNIIETAFQTDTGKASLKDFMPCYEISQGRLRQFPEVHRLVECREGEVALEVSYEPRLDYARGNTRLDITKHGVVASGNVGALSLATLVPFTVEGGRAVARFTLRRGKQAEFVLRYGTDKPLKPAGYNTAGKLKKTIAYWEQQAAGCVFTGPWREKVVRAYLALHLLVYSPTGAIIAAPTTSLPERIGGERNWDYRYAWLRDSSLTLVAFSHLGHKEEALKFFKWLLNVCRHCGPRAQILYDIDFKDPLDEKVLEHLSGYRDSRPVRVGNDAYQQRQLDVFGEVLEVAYSYINIGGRIGRQSWELLESFVNAACELWRQPDNGIWEIRGGPYHFVHSKLMCWVAVDRGIKVAEKLGYRKNIKHWRKVSSQIRDSILKRGWNPERQAFTQHYETRALDASNLLMSLFGFLPVSDPRIQSTIERTVNELSSNGLLRRYRTDETDDGLGSPEGAFLWCSFWLVRNLLRLGRLDEAVALYQRLLGYANHLGLFSEMVNPASGEALGNFPQALTHLAVIITGLELTKASQGENGGEQGGKQ